MFGSLCMYLIWSDLLCEIIVLSFKWSENFRVIQSGVFDFVGCVCRFYFPTFTYGYVMRITIHITIQLVDSMVVNKFT